MTRTQQKDLKTESGKISTKQPVSLLARAKDEHRAGRLDAAERLYVQAIKTAPDESVEARYRLGILYAQTGRANSAVKLIAEAVELNPGNATLLNGLGNACLAANRPADAVAAYRNALKFRPNFAEAYFNLGNALRQTGDLAGAAENYRLALSSAPGALPIHINLGVTLQELGEQVEAEKSLRQALAIDPRSFEARYNLGNALAAQGRLDDAIAAYRDALTVQPNAASVYVNLGSLLNQQNRIDEAIQCFKHAIELEPSLTMAHNNLGTALSSQNRFDEAAAAYRNALKLDPDAPSIHVNLAVALSRRCERQTPQPHWVEEAILSSRRAIELAPADPAPHFALGAALGHRGLLEEAFSHFRRHAELRYGPHAQPRTATAPGGPLKMKHDREQLDYLIQSKIIDDETARRIRKTSESGSPSWDALGGLFHIAGGNRLGTPAVSPDNDTAEIEAVWERSKPNVVVVDNLLTPEALHELQRFCWGSTIWQHPFQIGYIAALSEDGFAAPLLAQIARELAQKFPRIIRQHVLTGAWSVKCDNQSGGITIHADFAAVNVNFWITPDEANLDPQSGGVIIWDVPAPLDWDFRKYNQDGAAAYAYLERMNAKSIKVPYRANRAVIFDSDLFHETDRMNFKEGYLNRRMNVTMLYGYRHNDELARKQPK